ncbi:MAG TPA: thioesterase family protein, partial [Acidimicrobiia bacterium]|nr:thioesterase family protein [Acidimicrobiia bacterium]
LFLAPVPAGQVAIDVDVLRTGRGTAQLVARLGPADNSAPAVQVQGLFGSTRSSDLAFQNVQPPVVPPPRAVPARRHSQAIHFKFDDRTEWRPVSGVDEGSSDRVLAWERLRVGEPDPLALALHSDILGVAVERHGPFTILSLEIAIRFLATPTTPWVLQEIEAWHVGDGYATGPARLWDEAGRLCAIVNQTAQVRPAQTA